MSDDRELLELAAKAVGYNVICFSELTDSLRVSIELSGNTITIFDWNPWDSDADALQLLARMKMKVGYDKCQPTGKTFYVIQCRHILTASEIFDGTTEVNELRHTIVRAAAEIGKAMRREESLQELVDEGQRMGLYDIPEGK